MRGWMAAGVTMLLMTGCSTSPISAVDASPVPADRAFGLQIPPDLPHGRLIVTRDKGFLGSACSTLISVDGARVGEIWPGEVATFYVPEGRHIVGAEIDAAACPDVLKEREFTVVNDEDVRYRISIDSGFSMDLSPTAR